MYLGAKPEEQLFHSLERIWSTVQYNMMKFKEWKNYFFSFHCKGGITGISNMTKCNEYIQELTEIWEEYYEKTKNVKEFL